MADLKSKVHDFWNEGSCGEKMYLTEDPTIKSYKDQARWRYKLEPFILEFAAFDQWKNKKVLEIGVGLGADHQKFAEAGAQLYGLDLTPRAIEYAEKRLRLFNLTSSLQVGDAENLSFDDNQFDLVYSWGVLHHTPNTPAAVDEIWRILKPGGTVKVMIYHKYSVVGFMLWLRYGLLTLKPTIPLSKIYDKYLESPGTKAYSQKEARELFKKFNKVEIKTELTHGDLLSSEVGQRHRGLLLSIARKIWPRWMIKKFMPNNGLFMLITAVK